MGRYNSFFLLAAAAFAGLARADTCSDVESLTTVKVARPLDLAYIDEQSEYWSSTCSAIKPSCIIFPKTAAEVATVVKLLANNTERFAVKSGGHSPNNYWASVDNGPLIATQDLDHVVVDQATGIVKFGPGNRLDGLAQKLDGTGWSVAGGRIGNTGSGGLVLGGGLSYMSTQIGWTASTVSEYEIVLANGTITTVTDSNHPDLFRALKGGGNNFGIVTSYTAQALRQDKVYGGNLVFLHTPKTASKLLQAVRDFTEYNTDPRAAVILTAERTNLNLVDTWIMFLFYDGVDVPEGIFKNFTDAGPITNDARVRSYAEFVTFSNWVVLKGQVVTIATETIPLPSLEKGEEVMESIHAHWRGIVDQRLLVPGIVASIAYQPFPKVIARKALDAGGDLIDCDDSVDRLIIEMNYAFTLPSDYDKMDETMQETYGGIREKVLAWQRDRTLASGYMPIFMNYAYYRQDYFGRLRPGSRALAKAVATSVDPDGLFKDRTGGWKP
ncbi:FAD-binding domain-containing protein [Paramyrothecium foliicola]|nr:FAD-binding domain-containing protein [Paramyrothecium foliicola]